MSLFKQLEKLYPTDRFPRENFHTKIVAQVLRDSHELTLAWLRSLNVTELMKADNIRIITQETFGKLLGHLTDSRPDITIRIVADGKNELILIESKVESQQGSTQLQRYAEILAAEKISKALDRTSLVFITRDYEAAIATSTDPHFNFRVTRWFKFYKTLKAHLEKNSDGLSKQLKLFMEENRMSLGNQFRSTDLVAMENFLSARALMDETLDGEVSVKARKILGKVSNLKNHVEEQLRDQKRYTVFSELEGFDCAFGYWFPHENPDKPVWVGITLNSNPSAALRKEVIQAFHDWQQESNGSWQLDNENEWIGIRKGKAIQSLIAGDDHIRAIKDYLLDLLEEVRGFKKAHSVLRWPRVPESEA